MYKIGHAFTYLLLKAIVANERLISVRCELDDSVVNHAIEDKVSVSTSGGVVSRPVSTLKADILNITYDCCSKNNNVKMSTL